MNSVAPAGAREASLGASSTVPETWGPVAEESLRGELFGPEALIGEVPLVAGSARAAVLAPEAPIGEAPTLGARPPFEPLSRALATAAIVWPSKPAGPP